jgi:hypothetical protein
MRDWENKVAGEYAAARLGNEFGSGNDRLDSGKQNADAVLRGKLGADRANKIIGAMDEAKYGYNSYRNR